MTGSAGLQRVVQFFWDKELENTDLENPIVVLGRSYAPTTLKEDVSNPTTTNTEESIREEESSDASELTQYFKALSFGGSSKMKEVAAWPQDFLDDVYTKLWFTYRTKFEPLQKDKDGPSPLSLNNIIRGQNFDLNSEYFTTDCGWGCMIRTGQTLLANTLIFLKLGRDWRLQESPQHDEIVSLFIDSPEHPFSIHRFVEKGRELSGKKAGEWFGPSAAARSIQALSLDTDVGLNVYIGSDSGDIYEQDLYKIAKSNEEGKFKPTLILLGVRLGVEKVNQIYWRGIKDVLESKESVGISGGRPSSSHYFFGFQGDYLFYLDPHLPQPALRKDQSSHLEESVSASTEIVTTLDIQSVHTNKLRKLHLSEVDPSMLLGFLINDEQEWISWKTTILSNESNNKIIHISSDQSISHFYSRKPSFVVYDEDGDDFIDVGLEIDELKEENSDYENVNDEGSADDEEVYDELDGELGKKNRDDYIKEIAEPSEAKNEESDELNADRSIVMLSSRSNTEEFQDEDQLIEEEVNMKGDEGNHEEKEKVEHAEGEVGHTICADYEVYSGSIKEEDYENIGTASGQEIGYDDSTVEIESVKADDPYDIQEFDVLPLVTQQDTL